MIIAAAMPMRGTAKLRRCCTTICVGNVGSLRRYASSSLGALAGALSAMG
jgi:hypothetical protein